MLKQMLPSATSCYPVLTGANCSGVVPVAQRGPGRHQPLRRHSQPPARQAQGPPPARLTGGTKYTLTLLIYFLKASNIFSLQFVRTGNVSLTAPLVVRPAATVLQFITDTTDSAGSLAVEVAILRSSLAG